MADSTGLVRSRKPIACNLKKVIVRIKNIQLVFLFSIHKQVSLLFETKWEEFQRLVQRGAALQVVFLQTKQKVCVLYL